MKTIHAVSLLSCLTMSAPVFAEEARVLCVYDPAGKTGDYYHLMSQFATAASNWGTRVTLKVHTDEETAAKDYEAGQCDGVVATGVRLQRFNRFPSTIEAIGAVPNLDILKQAIVSLGTYETAAARLKNGEHETIGFIPVGAVYLFVRDRKMDSVPQLAGKRISTLTYDKASPVMVKRVGAIVVDADLGTLGPQFNNGDVDAAYLSAAGYRPFEMWRGLEPKGGILKTPLAQATLQVMIKTSRFPPGFSTKARKELIGKIDAAFAIINKAEADIPKKYWVPITAETSAAWEEMFLNVRLKLRDEEKAYDGQMLSALRKLRCTASPSRTECAEKRE